MYTPPPEFRVHARTATIVCALLLSSLTVPALAKDDLSKCSRRRASSRRRNTRGSRRSDGGRERNLTFGVNWYMNRWLKLMGNVVDVLEVEGGPFDGVEPLIWQMRFQVAL